MAVPKLQGWVSYSKITGNLKLFEAPQPVPELGLVTQVTRPVGWTATDGYYDADQALIRPDHKRLIRWESGQASLVLGITIESFFKSLGQSLSFAKAKRRNRK
jgi:hypothetical protein